MFKIHKIAIYAVLILTVISIYVILDSDSDTKKAANNGDLEEAEFASLTDADIDIIAAVKEKMKAVVPSAHAAE